MFDLGRLRVDRVIVHEVPQRLLYETPPDLVLSDVESPIDRGLRNYFKEKISTSLSSAAYRVAFDPNSTSPVPSLVYDYLGAAVVDFVDISQKMAQHLLECQSGVSPGGLLTVIATNLEGKRALAILKLEKEAAVRLQQTSVGGKRTFSMEHLRQLMLGDRTKVFKIGLFRQTGAGLDTIEGEVSDKQRGYQPTSEVAEFFLRRFLGCILIDAPDITTKRFFEVAQEFINERIQEPDRKARYQIALLSEMESQRSFLDIHRFAKDHLPTAERQEFINFLSEHDVPSVRFEKDTQLVKAHLHRIQLDFESGIAVLAVPEAFEEHIMLSDVGNGKTKVEIEDRLKLIEGRR